MSIQLVGQVLTSRNKRLSGTRKLVLVTLANYANEKGECWPSQKVLAGDCGISVRALSDHLKGLEADGFVVRETQHLGAGRGSTTVYRIKSRFLDNAHADIADAENAHANSVDCTGSSPRLKNRQEPSDTKLDSRADGPSISEIRSTCMEAAGLTDADLTPAMIAPTLIVHLIRPASGEPCDLQLDVIPAIQSCVASLRQRGQTLKSWSYCHDAIIRNRDARLSGAPEVEHQPGARPPQRPASTASARRHAERDQTFDEVADEFEALMGGQYGAEDYGPQHTASRGGGRVIDLDQSQFTRLATSDR